jgi:hypothetical protein
LLEATLREYPLAFGSKFASVIPHLIAGAGSTPQPDAAEYLNFDEKAYFAELKFLDLWEDAGMVDLIIYLRGSRALVIPDEWRSVMPAKLKVERCM